VAGKLRLELAQYREMAAFAQFGSDLDEDTRRQIERGKRLTEILKQSQYDPMPVEEQVAVIFAVVNGLLDDVTADKIADTQKTILMALRTTHKKVLESIREKKELDEKLERALTDAIKGIVAT